MADTEPIDPIFNDDPAMVAYARERGLDYDRHWFAPDSTQLLRHGFMPDGWDNMKGLLPGGGTGQLLHWNYELPTVGERRYTVVLFGIPESISLGSRIVCHDRKMRKEDATNTEADDQVVSLDDQAVRLESDAFVRRYSLGADHDQDQIGVWAVLDPSLVDWMAQKAPEQLSFELQDGTLCVFVPGWLTKPPELDAFCEGACRIAKHVRGASGPPAAPGASPDRPTTGSESREEATERELSRAKFDEPPADVKAAANAFRLGPIRTNRSWLLGTEAFFREYARSLGMKSISPSEFRAAHLDYEVPALLDHVAVGYLDRVGAGCFLLTSGIDDFSENGFVSLAVDIPGDDPHFFGFISDEATDKGFHDWSSGRTFGIWKEGGGSRSRTRKEMDDFIAFAEPELARMFAKATKSNSPE